MNAVWPLHVLRRFSTVPVNPRENDYYAPYNKLLVSLFPVNTPFTVAPQMLEIAGPHGSIDFIFECQVLWEKVPVFVLDIKTGPQLGVLSAREDADIRVRRRLMDLVGICPLPKLHAVSTMYTAEGPTITPPRIITDDQLTIDTAPRERWDRDVLEAEGADRLKAVVHEINEHALSSNLGMAWWLTPRRPGRCFSPREKSVELGRTDQTKESLDL